MHAWTNVSMNYNPTTTLYEATIPGQPARTNVKYKIIAYDNAENPAVNDNAEEYHVYERAKHLQKRRNI